MKTFMTGPVIPTTNRVLQAPGGIVQIVVWLVKKYIVPLGVVTTQSFFDPPEITSSQVCLRRLVSRIEDNGNCNGVTHGPHKIVGCGRLAGRMAIDASFWTLILFLEVSMVMWPTRFMANHTMILAANLGDPSYHCCPKHQT
jgi:hypothetical protein